MLFAKAYYYRLRQWKLKNYIVVRIFYLLHWKFIKLKYTLVPYLYVNMTVLRRLRLNILSCLYHTSKIESQLYYLLVPEIFWMNSKQYRRR